MIYPPSLQNLINEFSRFPTIGPKTAERFVFYLLKKSPQGLEKLANLIKNLKQFSSCQICGNFSEKNICPICAERQRDHSTICLVAEPQDLMAIEKTNEYKGVYHVLGGVIDNIQGIDPEKLRINELLQRIKKNPIKEIILALNPDLGGETTSLYLIDLLKPFKIKITCLARGLPMGSDLKYADKITLSKAIKKRETL
ncbi:MAG: recombination mediator RecR [Patescibacteria group bacterium]